MIVPTEPDTVLDAQHRYLLTYIECNRLRLTRSLGIQKNKHEKKVRKMLVFNFKGCIFSYGI